MSLTTAQKAGLNHFLKVLDAIARSPERLGAFFTDIPLTSLFAVDLGSLLDKLHDVGASAVEINAAADVLEQTIAAAGAITVDGTVNSVKLTGTAYAFTLAAPSAAMKGKILRIEMTGGGTDAKTLSLANVTGGTAATTASFNADGEALVLIGLEGKWGVLCQGGGVTLS
jgi:hypothetical protein